jgi:hypothetical protein
MIKPYSRGTAAPVDDVEDGADVKSDADVGLGKGRLEEKKPKKDVVASLEEKRARSNTLIDIKSTPISATPSSTSDRSQDMNDVNKTLSDDDEKKLGPGRKKLDTDAAVEVIKSSEIIAPSHASATTTVFPSFIPPINSAALAADQLEPSTPLPFALVASLPSTKSSSAANVEQPSASSSLRVGRAKSSQTHTTSAGGGRRGRSNRYAVDEDEDEAGQGGEDEDLSLWANSNAISVEIPTGFSFAGAFGQKQDVSVPTPVAALPTKKAHINNIDKVNHG